VVAARVTGSPGTCRADLTHTSAANIPGSPTSILRQLPGGAHLKRTNYVFNVADADGLTLLAANPAVATAQLHEVAAVRFDVRKFEWLGSSGAEGAMFSIRPDLPYKTFQEIKGRAAGADSGDDRARIELARRSAPAQGVCRPQAQAHHGLCREPRLRARARAQGSRFLDLDGHHHPPGGGARHRASAGAQQQGSGAGAQPPASRRGLCDQRSRPLADGDPRHAALDRRPFAVRPGTPADRVAMLRDALAKTVADPKFLAEMAQAQIDAYHIGADEVAQRFNAMINQPPHVVDAMGKYLKLAE